MYGTPDEMRVQMNKEGIEGAGSDPALIMLLTGASSTIDLYCNRPDGFVALETAAARYYAGSGQAHQRIDECVAITEVAVKASASDPTFDAWDTPSTPLAGDGDWLPCTGDKAAPNFNRLPYTLILIDPNASHGVFTTGKYTTRGGFRPTSGVARGLPTVKVTANWGYAVEVPSGILTAAIALAIRWFKQGESAWADTLASVEMGRLLYTKENQDIRLMLEGSRYVKPAIGRR